MYAFMMPAKGAGTGCGAELDGVGYGERSWYAWGEYGSRCKVGECDEVRGGGTTGEWGCERDCVRECEGRPCEALERLRSSGASSSLAYDCTLERRPLPPRSRCSRSSCGFSWWNVIDFMGVLSMMELMGWGPPL